MDCVQLLDLAPAWKGGLRDMGPVALDVGCQNGAGKERLRLAAGAPLASCESNACEADGGWGGIKSIESRR